MLFTAEIQEKIIKLENFNEVELRFKFLPTSVVYYEKLLSKDHQAVESFSAVQIAGDNRRESFYENMIKVKTDDIVKKTLLQTFIENIKLSIAHESPAPYNTCNTTLIRFKHRQIGRAHV